MCFISHEQILSVFSDFWLSSATDNWILYVLKSWRNCWNSFGPHANEVQDQKYNCSFLSLCRRKKHLKKYMHSSHEENCWQSFGPHSNEMQNQIRNITVLSPHCVKRKAALEEVQTKISGPLHTIRQCEYEISFYLSRIFELLVIVCLVDFI